MFKSRTTNYRKTPDEKLVIAIQNGDSKAFDELYNRYCDRLLYYFYRMLSNNNEIAQDFLQDIFYKVIDKPHLFDPERKFSTWLFSIAHNMCKNEYRRRNIRITTETIDNLDMLYQDNEESINMDCSVDAIFACLDKFDETHSSVFLLKYREGLSIEEISDILELPKGTIKSRLHYTRKKIQNELLPTIQTN